MIKQVNNTHAPTRPADEQAYAALTKHKSATNNTMAPSTKGVVTRALGAAMLLLSPATALAAVNKPSWRGATHRALAEVSGRQLSATPASAPETSSTYLVPKNAFNRTTGFLVLDVHTAGIAATLNNLTNSGSQIFDITSAGQISSTFTQGDTPKPCLAVENNHYANETPVWADVCNGQNNQKWEFANATIIDGNQYYTISFEGEPKQSHYCLDVAHRSNAVGAKVQIYPCNGGDNQKWMLVFAG